MAAAGGGLTRAFPLPLFTTAVPASPLLRPGCKQPVGCFLVVYGYSATDECLPGYLIVQACEVRLPLTALSTLLLTFLLFLFLLLFLFSSLCHLPVSCGACTLVLRAKTRERGQRALTLSVVLLRCVSGWWVCFGFFLIVANFFDLFLIIVLV